MAESPTSQSKVTLEVNKQMDIFSSGVEASAQSFIVDINEYVKRQSAIGVSSDQIVANLQTQMDQGVGVFEALKNSVVRVFQTSVMSMTAGTFNAAVTDDEKAQDMREWITVYSGNPSTKHCDTCLERNHETMSLSEWEQIGTPDNPFFDVHLSFGVPCYCILKPTSMQDVGGLLKEAIEI